MIKHIDKRIIINGYITIHISGGEHHQGEITISISIPTIKDIILDFDIRIICMTSLLY